MRRTPTRRKGNMPNETDKNKKTEQQSSEAETEAALNEERVVQIVNSAISSHSKRQAAAFDKTLEDKLGKFLEALKPKESEGDEAPVAEGKTTKGETKTAATKLMEQEMAALKRRVDESEAKRKEVEQRSREEIAKNELRQALTSKVRPELLDVAVGYLFAAQKAVRFDDDGNMTLAVTRSRAKGADAEEEQFTIAKGVEDWLKTDVAKGFIPAPGGRKEPPIRQTSTGNAAPTKQYDNAPVSEEERARRSQEFLEAQGIDLLG